MDDDDTTTSIPLLSTRPKRDGAAAAAAATAGSNIPVRICAEEEAKKQIGTAEPTTTKATATSSSSTTTVLQVEPEPGVPLIVNLTLEPVGGIDDSPTQLQEQTREQRGGGGGAAPGLQITTNDPPVRVVRTPREDTATVTARFDLVQQKRPSGTSSSSDSSSDSSSIRYWRCDDSCDSIGSVDRKDLHEADDEEERAIFELVQEDATAAAAEAITTRRPSASTNGTLRPQGESLSNEWELTPIPVLFRILGYADNITLMSMCLVCTQLKELISDGAGMENQLVRIFELRPSKDINVDDYKSPVRRFVSNMNRYFLNRNKYRMLQGYQHWKVQDVAEFYFEGDYRRDFHELIERLTPNLRLTGIVSLDMSSLFLMKHTPRPLYHAISFMVPNLQQLDLSHAETGNHILELFVARCPRLEILRWNYNYDVDDYYPFGIKASGEDLQSMNYLRELQYDNCVLEFEWDDLIDKAEDNIIDGAYDLEHQQDNTKVFEINAMSDSNNYPNTFLFCKFCNNPLERISIRNTKFPDENDDYTAIPQNVLMKFVRKAPSTLVWFRSDLSSENIRILQSERPGIQLVN